MQSTQNTLAHSAPFGLIEGPDKTKFCEQSSRCTWDKDSNPVPYCSLHKELEICASSDSLPYKLLACYNDQISCDSVVDPTKYTVISCSPDDRECIGKQSVSQSEKCTIL